MAVTVAAVALAAPAIAAWGLDAALLIWWPLTAALVAALLASAPLRERWLDSFLALPTGPRWVIGLLPVAGVVSALVAGGPLGQRLVYVAQVAAVLGLACAMPALLDAAGRRRYSVLLAVPALAGGTVLLMALADSGHPEASRANLAADFALWLCWTLPFAAALPAALPARRLRYLPHIVTSTLWSLAFAWAAYALIAAMLLGHLAAALAAPRPGRRLLRLQLVAAVIGYALYRGGHALLAVDAGGSAPAASGIYDAWRTIAHNYLSGAGPGHYALAPASITPGSALLRFAAEWGIPATAGLLYAAGTGLRAWFARAPVAPRRLKHPRALVIAASTAAAVALTFAIVLAGNIDHPVTQLYMALGIGTMLYLHDRTGRQSQRQPLGHHLALTVPAMLVVLVFVAALGDA